MTRLPIIRHLRWALRRALFSLVWYMDGDDPIMAAQLKQTDRMVLDQIWKGEA